MNIEEMTYYFKYTTEKLKYYIHNRFNNLNNIEDKFIFLCSDISYCLHYWTGYTFVGKKKSKDELNMFQNFYLNIFKLIKLLNDNEQKILQIEKNFINSVKYNGIVYRHLENIKKTNEIEYNGYYVSWSKEKENSYILTKLSDKIIRLKCEIPKDSYGFDLEQFQFFCDNYIKGCDYFNKSFEHEIIYPTIKKQIEIDKIYD